MSDASAFGFGKFVPGFDFLQNLGQAANPGAKGSPQGMPNMASWVAPTMNKATIQALEVQKMTLSTLQGMNVNMADLAKAFTAKMPDLNAGSEAKVAEEAPASEAPAPETPESAAKETPAVDPMQWWGALTQQFQNIAAAAVKDVAANAMKDVPPATAKKPTAKKAATKKAATKKAATKTKDIS
jgi:hypothetical protein